MAESPGNCYFSWRPVVPLSHGLQEFDEPQVAGEPQPLKVWQVCFLMVMSKIGHSCPGHRSDHQPTLVYHYYGANNNGRSILGINRLVFDSAGWPPVQSIRAGTLTVKLG
jgi:hypothetical protein